MTSTAASTAAAAPAVDPVREHARRMAALLVDYNLHPHAQLHSSWLPADWPARHRRPRQLGPLGRSTLDAWWRARLPAAADGSPFDASFETPTKRLALLDGASLRAIALYIGLAAHRPLLRQRALGGVWRRVLKRGGPQAAAYLDQRAPELTALRMNADALQQRPRDAVRLVWRRGARLLLALVAAEGPAVLARVRLKLPRRQADGALPTLDDEQRQQLDEFVQFSVLPERLPQWDWLF